MTTHANRLMVSPFEAVRSRESMPHDGVGRVLRISVVAGAVLVCSACIAVLAVPDSVSRPGALGEAGRSTPDLIGIMEGNNDGGLATDRDTLRAAQGMLFAGGAGGDVVKTRSGAAAAEDMVGAGSIRHATRQADELWEAAMRANKVSRDSTQGKARSTAPAARAHAEAQQKAYVSKKDVGDGSGLNPVSKADAQQHAATTEHAASGDASAAAAEDDAHARMMEARAVRSAREAREDMSDSRKEAAAVHHEVVRARRAAQSLHQQDGQELASSPLAQLAARRAAEAQAVRRAEAERAEKAKASPGKALEALEESNEKWTQGDQARAAALAKSLALPTILAKESLVGALGPDDWTTADAARAARLAKKFAHDSKPDGAMKRALDQYLDAPGRGTRHGESSHDKNSRGGRGHDVGDAADEGGRARSRSRDPAARESGARRSDSRGDVHEHPSGTRAAHAGRGASDARMPTSDTDEGRAKDPRGSRSAKPAVVPPEHRYVQRETQSLQRQTQMHADDEDEADAREKERLEERTLYSEGYESAKERGEERAGEDLVNKLKLRAGMAKIMQQVEVSGIAVAGSLKQAISGDDSAFGAFVERQWLPECGGSQHVLRPLQKQVLALMESARVENASAWLGVEQAQRRAADMRAQQHAAEDELLQLVETDDTTKAVEMLENLRTVRRERQAERNAHDIHDKAARESSEKVSLLRQQRAALKVLSHAEEAQALSGPPRKTELDKAASSAQHAVNAEDKTKMDGHYHAAHYVAGYEGKLLAVAERPWSLSAQAGVQALLGDINSKILKVEHAEEARNDALAALERKVHTRKAKLADVDAADAKLQMELKHEHATVKRLRNEADAAAAAAVHAQRHSAAQGAVAKADLRAAHQVLVRLQALIDVCNEGELRLLNSADTVHSSRPSSTAQTSVPAADKAARARDAAPAAPAARVAAPETAGKRVEAHVEHEQERLARIEAKEQAVQARANAQVDRLERKLRVLHAEGDEHRRAPRVREGLHADSLAACPAGAGGRGHEIRVGARAGAKLESERQALKRAEEYRQLGREMHAENRHEAAMEASEDEKLADVASMIARHARQGQPSWDAAV